MAGISRDQYESFENKKPAKEKKRSFESQEKKRLDEHPREATDHVTVVNPEDPEEMTPEEIARLSTDIRLGQTRLQRNYSLDDVGFRHLRRTTKEGTEGLEYRVYHVEYKTFGIARRIVGDELASTEVLDKIDEEMKGKPFQKFFLVQIDEEGYAPARHYMLFESGLNWMTCISEDTGIQIEMRNARKRVHNRIIVNGSDPKEWPADKFEFEAKMQAIEMCIAIAFCA